MPDYSSVEWHTDSTGKICEIAVEYNQTLMQWLFCRPATKRRWRTRDGKEWMLIISGWPNGPMGETSRSVGKEEVDELLSAMDYVHRTKFRQDLEDRCRKVLHKD